ncbi:hypothetical protein RIR_jg33415.t1 [Rhizophagus irregularis DAOM 181602=DAOM 197198]|nr:hypothetical protein RIR_jg33415.t1 [Rhizophagus irregularis DAOM 181602=DAOM 197198]
MGAQTRRCGILEEYIIDSEYEDSDETEDDTEDEMGTTSILDEWRKISYDIRPFLLNHAINGNVLGYTEVIERQGFR